MNRTKSRRYTLTDLLTGEEILQRASTRDFLLGHGIRLFHRYGVDGTSVGRLLKVAGKSKSQFYSHFDSREDFICKVLDRQMSTMIRVSARTELRKVSDFSKWFEPYEELGTLPGHLGCPTGPLATDLSPSCEVVQAEASKQFARWQDHIEECLRTLALSEGIAHKLEPKMLARQMCCSIQGAFLLGRVHQSGEHIRLVGEQYQQLLNQLAN